MPRPRFLVSTRWLMALVALTAVVLAWAIARPYPGPVVESAVVMVFWSDGSMTTPSGPYPIKMRGGSWYMIVDWPDGSTSFYVTLR